jgi:hypothetical protein
MDTAACADTPLTCRACGQQIVLVTGDLGPVLADARAFLAAHAHCLSRRR